MKRSSSYALTGGLVVALVATLSLMIVVFPKGSEDVAEPGGTIAGETATPADGTSEGVKVHGHWTIEVRDPDGTLVSRRQFDNDLVPTGARDLSRVLAGSLEIAPARRLGLWGVNLVGFTNSICPEAPCTLQDVRYGDFFSETPSLSVNLTVTAPDTGPNSGKLVLSGTFTASADGGVDAVDTTFNFSNFTATTLGSTITVVNGQQILVTAIISFS